MADTQGNFDDLTMRLDEIIQQVRSKDTSLERCLDLFDEAIEIGSRAVDMVDTLELTPREEDQLAEANEADAAAEHTDGQDADAAPDVSDTRERDAS